MTPRFRRTTLLIAAVALASATTACGPGKSSESAIESAKSNLAKNRPADAIVELKSALATNPKSGEARLLLGQAFVQQDKPADAAVELRKAFDAGYNDTVTVPLLAQALLQSQQGKDLIADFGAIELKDAGAQGSLQASLALAYATQGDRKRALTLADEAIGNAPKLPSVLLAKARVIGLEGRVDEALVLVDECLQIEPKSVEAWILKADVLLLGKRDRAKAQEVYKQILELQPSNLAAHLTLFGLYSEQNDLEAMRGQYQSLAKVLPNHPQTVFMQAQLAALDKDFAKAKGLMDRVMKSMSANPLALQFAGSVELNLNSFVQAEKYLTQAIQLRPSLRSARRLLARVFLKTNQANKAVETLAPNIKGDQPDFASVALMAESLLFLGDTKSAELLFQKAAKLNPSDSRVKTSMSLLQLGKGRVDAAFAELRDVAASSPDTFPDMALITAHFRRKEFASALMAIESMQKKEPKSPLVDLLRGRVLVASGKLTEARQSLMKALEKDAAYLPAVAGLASIDMIERKPDEAEKRFVDFLGKHPKVPSAQLALAELKVRNGRARRDIVELLESIIRGAPNEPGARLALLRYLTSVGDKKAAFNVAQAAASSMPENSELLLALGELQLATGDHNQAMITFAKVVAKKPDSAFAHLKLGESQMAAKEFVGAQKSAAKALELEPNSLAANRSLIASHIAQGNFDKAMTLSRTMQKSMPKNPFGYQFEGDIEAGRQNIEAAIRAYRAGLEKTQGGIIPEKLYALIEKSKGKEEARKFAEEWQKKHPGDAGLSIFLGNTALIANDWPTAELHFQAAVKASPSNAVALNNLAWVTAHQGKAGAVSLAERAVAASPNTLTYQDTLALALVREKQFEKAIQTAKDIFDRAPFEPASRLSLAKIYVLAGEKKLAGAELDALDRLGEGFAGKREVAELRKQLR